MHGARSPSFWICVAVIGSSACEPRKEISRPEATSTKPVPAASKARDVDPIVRNAERMVTEGRRIFRYDTFGSEAFWGTALKLHHAIAGSARGGVGSGLSPKAALGVGLKVDVEKLPDSLATALRAGKVDLDDVDNTVALLRANAVVGVKGIFADERITSIGITCALCHSTVDDSLAPGIGKRLDGWANRDLDVGAVIGLAPDLTPVTRLLGVDDTTLHKVLKSWGQGKFDAQVFLDGTAFRPDGRSAATLIPPAFGLAGINMHTSTGWGSITYWNAFVANLEMHGQGTFYDPRLDDATRFPVAAKARSGHVANAEDQITAKLAALQFYQLAIPAPMPASGSFDAGAATRGQVIFIGAGKCATCHVPPLYTEPGYNMHTPAEIGIDAFQSERSPDKRYRTAPLKGLFAHQKGGFYHDGRFATLDDVVKHYDVMMSLALTPDQQHDLVEFLKSL
jgi:hypothetical protein